jgi:hypothetical protein
MQARRRKNRVKVRRTKKGKSFETGSGDRRDMECRSTISTYSQFGNLVNFLSVCFTWSIASQRLFERPSRRLALRSLRRSCSDCWE